MADTGTMKLLVNTPERVFFNGEATFVELATSEGEIGVYPQHIPLTAVLVPCVLTIHQNDGILFSLRNDNQTGKNTREPSGICRSQHG